MNTDGMDEANSKQLKKLLCLTLYKIVISL